MQIALVHDYIKEYGGAERVLEALYELYPDAHVYTSVFLPDFLGPHRERFEKMHIHTSWAQNIPFVEKLISPLRLLSPFLFRSFDLSQYDVVIVSATGAYTPNAIRLKCHPERSEGSSLRKKDSSAAPQNDSRKSIHICYCHTPPRYLYGYETAREWKKSIILRSIGEFANHFLRIVDFYASRNVDFFIANSIEVKSRIKKFYRRDSVVVYPPVEMQESGIRNQESGKKNHNSKFMIHDSYYLAGGRLARPKHIDLIVRACQKENLPLKIFGRGFAGYDGELGIRNQESGEKSHNSRFIIPDSNIEFLGEVTDEEKYELMRNAKAYLFAATDEDFGITPVEAMSQGCPVIAYRGGGVLETIIEGKTGFFFDELTEESLLKTIKCFDDSNHRSMRQACIKQAEKFSKERFKTEIQMFVEVHR